MQALTYNSPRPDYTAGMAQRNSTSSATRTAKEAKAPAPRIKNPGGRPTQAPRSALGGRIVAAREAAGWSQQELSAKVGISQRVLAHWERHAVEMRADQLAALADALAVTTDYLLGREEAKAPKGGMVGKTRRVFEEVNSLPRHQQEKVLDFVAHFIKGFGSGGGNTKAA